MAAPRRMQLTLATGLVLSGMTLAQGPKYGPIGDGCAGILGTPSLAADSGALPVFGARFRTRLTKAADGAAIGIIGLDRSNWAGFPLPLDLGSIGMPGCLLHTDVRYSIGLVVRDEEASWDIDLPSLPIWQGRSFYQQVLVLDTAANSTGAVLSNANEGVIDVEKASPLVKIVFPPPRSLTNETSVMVRGTAVDPDGIAEVRVNGHLATSTDGFLNWQVRVPLDQVTNTLTVEARDSLGNTDPTAAEAVIESAPYVWAPQRVTLNATGSRVLVIDEQSASLLSIDYASGDRQVISSESKGTGPAIWDSRKMVVDGGRAIILSRLPHGILSIDLATGDRTVLASPSTGWGLTNPIDFALDNNRAVVIDAFSASVVSIDLATGLGTSISHAGLGSGPSIPKPIGIVVDGNRAIISDETQRAVIEVDLSTGDRELLSGFGAGTGPEIGTPSFLALDGNRVLLVDREPAAVLAVDLATGDRTALTGEFFNPPPFLMTTGEGPEFGDPFDIAVQGDLALVSDRENGSLMAVDLTDGRRREFLAGVAGTGPAMANPDALVFSGDVVFLLDSATPASIQAVDMNTGERRLVSGAGLGSGQELLNPKALTGDGTTLVVANQQGTPTLLSVDIATGNRTVLADLSYHPSPLAEGTTLALHGGQALLLDPRSDSLQSVNLVSGVLSVVSDQNRGIGHPLENPRGLSVDDHSALVIDRDGSTSLVLAVDLVSGDRRVISGGSMGNGPELGFPFAVTVQGSRALVADSFASIKSISLANGDRDIVSAWQQGKGPIPRLVLGMEAQGDLLFLTDKALRALTVVDTVTGERVILSRRIAP